MKKGIVLMLGVIFLIASASILVGAPITLRFPHHFFGHGGNFEAWINGAVDQFEKENPNVHVERESVPYDSYWDKMDVAIAGGNAPDVAEILG